MSIIDEVNKLAKPMDVLLLGSNDLLGLIIRNAQSCQTKDGSPSMFNHCALYVNEDTILESTIDFERYETGSRLDNGVQYNAIDKILKYRNIMLIQFPLSDLERELVCRRADRLYKQRIKYPILGLVGSLLSFWIFKWQSNPLQGKHSLYCSAFIQEAYEAVSYDFDSYHTARNTSPEMIYRFDKQGKREWWIR